MFWASAMAMASWPQARPPCPASGKWSEQIGLRILKQNDGAVASANNNGR